MGRRAEDQVVNRTAFLKWWPVYVVALTLGVGAVKDYISMGNRVDAQGTQIAEIKKMVETNEAARQQELVEFRKWRDEQTKSDARQEALLEQLVIRGNK